MSVGGPAAPNTEDPLLGRVLSERYRILSKLGEGGMGVVYLAEHVVIEKKIALKVLFPDLTRRADLVQRFMQEAKSASRINHENVIDITDFGQSPEGYVFIAMEYLSGQDLGQVLKGSGPMPWPRAQPIVLQIVKALRAAHERGIIHRDMKPENIFVLPRDDGREFVKVLDFGIAKVMGLEEDVPRLTRTGMIFGTPEYMSPEQAQGQSVDHRVDIYAVGCIMFHILTGRVPFKADSFMGILSKQMMETPESPRALNPAIDPAVEAAILKAMEKDPAKRFQTMREFAQAVAPLGLGGAGADLSGAISTSSRLSVPQTVFPTGASLSSSVRVVTGAPAQSTTPATPAPLPNATHELEGRASMPLAAANPEVRRSRTEMFDNADGALRDGPPRGQKRAGNGGLIVLAIAAVAVVAAGLFVLRQKANVSPPVVPATLPAALAPVMALPPPVVPPAVVAAPAPPAATPPPGGDEAARSKARSGATAGGKRHRSSREAIDALHVGEPVEAPAPAAEKTKPGTRTPDELKNPFATP
jgi:serine/threonine protein kinase